MHRIPHAPLLAVVLLAALTSAGCTADDELAHGPDLIYVSEASGEDAATVVVGQGLQGSLEPGGDEDRFSVTLRAGDVLSVYVDRDLPEDTLLSWSIHGTTLRTAYGLRAGEVFQLFAHKDGAYALTLSGSPQAATPYSLLLQSAAPIATQVVAELPAVHTSSDREIFVFDPTVPENELLLANLHHGDPSTPSHVQSSVLLWSRESQQLRRLGSTSASPYELPVNTVGAHPEPGDLLLLSYSILHREALELTLSLQTLDDTPLFPAADLTSAPEAVSALTAGDIDFIRLPKPEEQAIYRVTATSPSGGDLTLNLNLLNGQPLFTATTQEGAAALEFELDRTNYNLLVLQITTADGAAADYKVSLETTAWSAEAPLDLANTPLTGDTPQGSWAWRSVTTDTPALLLSRLDAGSHAVAISQRADTTLGSTWYASDSPNLVAQINPEDGPILWGVRHPTFHRAPFTLEHAALIPLTEIPQEEIIRVEPDSTLILPPGPAHVVGYPAHEAASHSFNLSLTVPANQRVLLYATLDATRASDDSTRFVPSPADAIVHTYYGTSSLHSQQVAWEMQGGAQDTVVTFSLESECTLFTDENNVVYTCTLDGFQLRVEPLQ